MHDTDLSDAALTAYLEFILRRSTSKLVSYNEAIRVLEPLGIEARLVCRAGPARSESPLLVVTTTDPDHELALHQKRPHPREGRSLVGRRQVGAETWEYELNPPDEQTLAGEISLRLSKQGRVRHIELEPPILTLALAAGWGQDINGIEADAALDGVVVAVAVTELLTGMELPERDHRNQYVRFRAVAALAEHLDVSLYGGRTSPSEPV